MARRKSDFVPGWMDYAAAARYLCYSERQIKLFYRRGLLKASRVSTGVSPGHPRFRRQDLDEFMLNHSEQSLAEIAGEITEPLIK